MTRRIFNWNSIRRWLSAAAIAAALGCGGQFVSAQEPSEASDDLANDADFVAALQPGGGGQRGARGGGPARDRGPEDRPQGDRPRGDRSPGDRPSEDRGPEPRRPQWRGPGDGFGGGSGGTRGGGGFGGGRGFGPPRGGDGPDSLDARIARLEHKLDAILHELHSLRGHHPPMARLNADRLHMIGGPPRPPKGPSAFARSGMRGDGPAREWDSPEPRRAPPPAARRGDGPPDAGPRRVGPRDYGPPAAGRRGDGPPGGGPRGGGPRGDSDRDEGPRPGARRGGPPRDQDGPPRGADRERPDDAATF